jgi:hypothetical protein
MASPGLYYPVAMRTICCCLVLFPLAFKIHLVIFGYVCSLLAFETGSHRLAIGLEHLGSRDFLALAS